MEKGKLNSRREFLQKLITATAVAGIYPYVDVLADSTIQNGARNVIPQRQLGKTGQLVGIYSLGGQGSIEIPGKEDISVEIINRAIDLGINYIDTAAAYGRATPEISKEDAMGTSERNMGQVMKHRRDEVFLATKTHDRTYDGSMRLLEKSLKNLQTDHIDLWQIHNVKAAELPNLKSLFATDGVVKAMERARDEKIVRYLGITGHENPEVLRTLSEMYEFDNILVAINAADKHYDSFIDKLLPAVIRKNMGIVGMKIPARDRIFSHGGIITMKEAMDYVLSLPVSTVIIGLDKIPELEENIKIAKEFKLLSANEMLAIEDKTFPYFKDLQFFKGQSEWPVEW